MKTRRSKRIASQQQEIFPVEEIKKKRNRGVNDNNSGNDKNIVQIVGIKHSVENHPNNDNDSSVFPFFGKLINVETCSVSVLTDSNQYKSTKQDENVYTGDELTEGDDEDSIMMDSTVLTEEGGLGEWELISHTNRPANLILWVEHCKPKGGGKERSSLRGELLMDSSSSHSDTIHLFLGGTYNARNCFGREKVERCRGTFCTESKRHDDSSLVKMLADGYEIKTKVEAFEIDGIYNNGRPGWLTLRLLEDNRTLKVEFVNSRGVREIHPYLPVFSFTGYRKGDRRKRSDRTHKCCGKSQTWAQQMEQELKEKSIKIRKSRRERIKHLGLELNTGESDNSEIDDFSDGELVLPCMNFAGDNTSPLEERVILVSIGQVDQE